MGVVGCSVCIVLGVVCVVLLQTAVCAYCDNCCFHPVTQVGWEDADVFMCDLGVKMCNGFHLRERSGFVTVTHLCYRFQCGFFNYLKCAWQLHILVKE